MKKIFLYTKSTFHVSNIGLILTYLYPGSILGWLIYDDKHKQPQLTSDFLLFSSNHVYAFLVLSFLGLLSYYKNKVNILFIYLFFISIFLEICHIFIPHRSFQYQDIFGNFLGVFIIFIFFILYQLLKSNK
jgi:VanZ family protein